MLARERAESLSQLAEEERRIAEERRRDVAERERTRRAARRAARVGAEGGRAAARDWASDVEKLQEGLTDELRRLEARQRQLTAEIEAKHRPGRRRACRDSSRSSGS